MAPEKTATYHVHKEFVLVRPNHADGDMTMTEGSMFDPIADGFEGTPEELAALIAEGTINEVYTGPMAKYKVIGQIFPLNEDGTPQETSLEIGSIHEIPEGVWDDFVAEGKAVKMTDEKIDAGIAPEGAVTDNAAQATPARQYMGKTITSHFLRKVGDKQYHHVRLEDGTTHDLTKEEYEAVMEA